MDILNQYLEYIVLKESVNLSYSVKKLTKQKEKLEFFKKYKDSPKRNSSEIYAVVLDNTNETNDIVVVVGGIVLEKDIDSEILKIYENKNLKIDVFVSFFYIDEDYRRKGLGIDLFKTILKKHDLVGLSTDNHKDNQRALNLYRIMGFEKIHTDSKYSYWYKS